MASTAYSAEESDALQEVVNVAMGTAASSLARVLGAFVRLPVPAVRLIDSVDVVDTIGELTGEKARLTAVRQAFTSSLRGEALVVFANDSAYDLAPFLGYEAPLSHADIEEILLEISNIVVGACIGGIAIQLEHDVIFSAPSFMGRDVSIEQLVELDRMTWERSLLVEVNFRLEDRDFVCHILLFWPGDAIDAVRTAIARLLGDG